MPIQLTAPSILSDPDAYYDARRDQIDEEHSDDRPDYQPGHTSIRLFGVPHFAITEAGCDYCGAQVGFACTGEEIKHLEYQVHMARFWAAGGKS